MTKLTNRTVAAIKPGDRDLFVWDDELPGFGDQTKHRTVIRRMGLAREGFMTCVWGRLSPRR